MHAGHKVKIAAIFLVLALFMAALTGCSNVATVSRDFTVDQDDVLIELYDDGLGMVTETISYTMLRSNDTFEFSIDYSEAGSIDLGRIEIAAECTDTFVEIQPFNKNISGSTATYETEDDGAIMKIRVTAVSAKDTHRSIRLSYQLAQAVWLNKDNAVFKNRFFTLNESTPTAKASMTIQLPNAIPDAELWYLPISRTTWMASRPQPDQLVLSGEPRKGEQAMTLYCLFPVSAFSNATHHITDQSWEALTTEARQAEAGLVTENQLKTNLYYFIFIMFALALLFGLFIYWFFDRESTASFRQRYWQDLPKNCPPAMLSIILRKDWPGRLILSTLLDLVRRGELTLRGNVFSLPATADRQGAELLPYEAWLVQWLFESVTQDSMISTAEIRKFARNPEAAGEMQAFHIKFRQLIDQQIKQDGLIDENRIRKGRLSATLAALGYLALTVTSFLILLHVASLLLLLPSLGFALYAWKIRRLAPAGRELFAVGCAIKRTMSDCDGHRTTVDQAFFAASLPLSVALAVDGQLIKNLLETGAHSSRPFEDYSLEQFGVVPSAVNWEKQVAALGTDLKVMESMLSASLLLSAGLHH